MLRSLLPPREAELHAVRQQVPADGTIDLGRLVNAARRQARIVIACIVVGVLLAGVFLFMATPRYTAATQILIDPSPSRASDTEAPRVESSQVDAMILSQVELIRSMRIALAVVDKLDLTKNSAFTPKPSLLSTAKNFVVSLFRKPTSDAADSGDPRRAAAAQLQTGVGIERVGRTWAMSLTYTSPDPVLAAKIANAYADAYLNDGLESNFDNVERTSRWLQDRLTDLQANAQKSDLAVQAYRTEHGLIAADGKLVSEQQLTEINSQLILAQADTARAQARYEQFRSLLHSGQPNALLNAAVATGLPDTSVIGKLRGEYQDATTRLADVVKRWGPDHPEAVNLKKQVAEDEQQLTAELGRIENGYQNDYDVARSREQSLRTSVETVQGTTASNNQTLVQLRALQQQADTDRAIYQAFLQRNQEADQAKSFPIQTARVISDADRPTAPSYPTKKMILALGGVLGLLAGAGIGAAREFSDRTFRSGDEIRRELGLEVLGVVPAIGEENGAKGGDRQKKDGGPMLGSSKRPRALLNYVADHPFSGFAETLRRAKIASDLLISQSGPKVIGVVSVLPKEGKSTISSNFAQLLAAQGARTLLIDADLRNPSLTRELGGSAVPGLLDIVLENRSLDEVAFRDRNTRLVFLPAGNQRIVSHTTEILSSQAMRQFLKNPGEEFDYIVVDLPPMAPVADARAFASQLDGTLLVVGWGQAARGLIRTTLADEPEITSKNLGVVLNNVDMKQLKLYSEPGSYDYFYRNSYYKG